MLIYTLDLCPNEMSKYCLQLIAVNQLKLWGRLDRIHLSSAVLLSICEE